MTKQRRGRKGFTLIELLIVIGLLGALTALVLPSLTADREEALGDVCDYNQAGTVRVLKQFKQLTGVYPDDMHNGMTTAATGALAMKGLPEAQSDHMGDAATACPSLVELTADQADSLIAAGIDSICSGEGLTRTAVAEDVAVASAAGWNDDSGSAMTFDGHTIAEWSAAATSPDEKDGIVVVLWIAPTTDWSGDYDDDSDPAKKNKDWGNGNVSLGLDIQGQCPIPAVSTDADGEVTFAYYMAYFKVYNDGTAAKLIGTSCPECGVMNP